MKYLAISMGLLGGSTMLAASPALAGEPFAPNTFGNMANVFSAADLDSNGSISSNEYVMLRNGMVDQNWLATYRGDAFDRMVPTIVRNFSMLDRDDDGMLSQAEFMNLTKEPLSRSMTGADGKTWDWKPEYMSLTYYLTANSIDADTFNGRPVMNLKGDEIGTISNIMKREDTGHYYALVAVADKVMDPTPSQHRAKLIGVPLNNVLLSTQEASLMLTRDGEEYFLADENRPRVNINQMQDVDRLTGI